MEANHPSSSQPQRQSQQRIKCFTSRACLGPICYLHGGDGMEFLRKHKPNPNLAATNEGRLYGLDRQRRKTGPRLRHGRSTTESLSNILHDPPSPLPPPTARIYNSNQQSKPLLSFSFQSPTQQQDLIPPSREIQTRKHKVMPNLNVPLAVYVPPILTPCDAAARRFRSLVKGSPKQKSSSHDFQIFEDLPATRRTRSPDVESDSDDHGIVYTARIPQGANYSNEGKENQRPGREHHQAVLANLHGTGALRRSTDQTDSQGLMLAQSDGLLETSKERLHTLRMMR